MCAQDTLASIGQPLNWIANLMAPQHGQSAPCSQLAAAAHVATRRSRGHPLARGYPLGPREAPSPLEVEEGQRRRSNAGATSPTVRHLAHLARVRYRPHSHSSSSRSAATPTSSSWHSRLSSAGSHSRACQRPRGRRTNRSPRSLRDTDWGLARHRRLSDLACIARSGREVDA